MYHVFKSYILQCNHLPSFINSPCWRVLHQKQEPDQDHEVLISTVGELWSASSELCLLVAGLNEWKWWRELLAQFSWQTMQCCHSLEHTCVVNICEFTVKTLKTGDIDCSAAVLQVCLRQRLVFIDLLQWIMQCGAGAGVGGLNCSNCSLSPPVLQCCSLGSVGAGSSDCQEVHPTLCNWGTFLVKRGRKILISKTRLQKIAREWLKPVCKSFLPR